jgi:hypothetical protein
MAQQQTAQTAQTAQTSQDPAVQAYGPLPSGYYWGLDPSSGNPTPYNQKTQQPAPEVDPQKKQDDAKQSKQKSQKQKLQDTLDTLNEDLKNAQWTDFNGQGAGSLGQKIGGQLAQLPNQVALNWLKQNNGVLKNTGLLTAISNAAYAYNAPPTTTAATKPVYDPLALQTMWHDVFGPAWNSAMKQASSSGQPYLSAMQNAIAGSNASPAQQQQMKANAQSQAALLSSLGQKQAVGSATQIPYDTLIATLQQGSAAATAAQGEAEKVYGVQQAAATAPYLTGQTTGTVGSSTAGSLLQSALGGSTNAQTLTPAQQISANQTTNPLYPNIPGYTYTP